MTNTATTTEPAPTPIDYSEIPSGRIGHTISGGSASLVIKPAAENNGTIVLYIYTDVGSNSWPVSVHHGRAIMIGLSPDMCGESVREILESHEDEIRAIDAAYLGTRWDGNNHVGTWQEEDEFSSADEEPTETLRTALQEAASYWSVSDYFDPAIGDVARNLYGDLGKGKSVSNVARDEVEGAARDGQALIDEDEVEKYLQDLLDNENTAPNYRINLAKICEDRFSSLIKAGKTVEEATKATREVLPKDKREYGVVMEERFVILCECSEGCEEWLYDGDSVVVEVMPKHLRASHDAAGNCGVYPANGAERLVCCDDCAIAIVEDENDPRWAHLVEP